MTQESIIDTSRPNAGRIYDYILGGYHNFEVDRQAAEQIIRFLPFLPKVLRLQRWCLQDLAIELTEKRGFEVIIDFASGLPTNDHLHYVVPPDTQVIYSDYDPMVVQYAHQILGNTPNVYYFHADARRPEELLDRPEVAEILQGRREVALIYWGISGFLTGEDLAHAARSLYRWSGPRSCWAFNAQGIDLDLTAPGVIQTHKVYEQMGSPLNPRSLDRVTELLEPWHADERGYVSLLNWHGFDPRLMSQEDRQVWGPLGGNYGCFLIK